MNNTKPAAVTASAVRAVVVQLLAVKAASTEQKAKWLETQITAILGLLIKRKTAAAAALADKTLADAT